MEGITPEEMREQEMIFIIEFGKILRSGIEIISIEEIFLEVCFAVIALVSSLR